MVHFPSRDCPRGFPLRGSKPDSRHLPSPKATGHVVQSPPVARVGCVPGGRPAPHPPPGQPGLLLIEHLVAEVIRLGSAVVFASHSLVVHEDEGPCSCHQGKGSHHDEDKVASSQAWLRTWTLTCRERDGRRWEVCPNQEGRISEGLVPPVAPALRPCGEGGTEGLGQNSHGARSPRVSAPLCHNTWM